MGFELDLAAIRSAAKNRGPCTGYAATAATAATKPPQFVASVANVATVASSHEPKTASLPPANDPQGFDPGESALMLLAMRFCDAINASDKAREDWRRDVLETPPHLRQGLQNYLREQLRRPHLLWRTP